MWVAQEGTPGDFFHSISLLPAGLEKRIEAVEGVEEAFPLVSLTVVFRLRGKDVDFRLQGVDPATGVGGPPAIDTGKGRPGRGQLVVGRGGKTLGDVESNPSVGIACFATLRGEVRG